MEPKFKIGQKVLISPAKNQSSPARDADIEQYAGQSGVVTDYYWMRPSAGTVFYIYTIKIGDSEKEVVLYEDELIELSWKQIPRIVLWQPGAWDIKWL